MFSHIFTAARGLFTGQVPAQPNQPSSGSSALETYPPYPSSSVPTPSSKMTEETSKMLTPAVVIESPVTNGKRKVQSTTLTNAGGHENNSKRRRTTNTIPEEARNGTVNGTSGDQDTGVEKQGQNGDLKKGNHMRFGSEEPVLPLDTTVEETSTVLQNGQGHDEESSDDEAPEAVDNSTQLTNIKAEAKKRENVKQRSVDCFEPYFGSVV